MDAFPSAGQTDPEVKRTHPLDSKTRLGNPTAPGVVGNSRLTGELAVVLLVLLAVEGVTIFRIRPMLGVHFFVGMLLIGPVLAKIASVGYRFARYYRGQPDYVRKGPPPIILRVLGPGVVLATVALLATGVTLAIDGPPDATILLLHKISFVAWVVLMTAHVLGHLRSLPRLSTADLRSRFDPPLRIPGTASRFTGLALALAGGLVLALATTSLAGP